ncbi:MAG: DUF3953 domain-containing protein [Clostridia bacterium]|nr:DUF3953 domain-containing protein [Clostridia bacterium]
MKILVFILSSIIFTKTLSYGIFEIKKEKNKTGGIVVIFVSIASLILPNLMVYIRGI